MIYKINNPTDLMISGGFRRSSSRFCVLGGIRHIIFKKVKGCKIYAYLGLYEPNKFNALQQFVGIHERRPVLAFVADVDQHARTKKRFTHLFDNPGRWDKFVVNGIGINQYTVGSKSVQGT